MEREALAGARKAIEQERAQMLEEIARLDAELEAARETICARDEALETERQAHVQTKRDAREAWAFAGEREKRLAALEVELDKERQARAAALALMDRRVEAAILVEHAAHVDELRAVLQSLQEGRAGKPEG